VKFGKIAFQRGDPADVDVFEHQTTATSSGNESDEPLSPSAIDALIANATRRTLMAQAPHELVVHQPAAAVRHLVGDQDAQKIYPHTSCLFIAK